MNKEELLLLSKIEKDIIFLTLIRYLDEYIKRQISTYSATDKEVSLEDLTELRFLKKFLTLFKNIPKESDKKYNYLLNNQDGTRRKKKKRV